MEDPAIYFKKEGLASFRDGDFDDAVLCFEKGLGFLSAHDGRSTEFHYLIAYALFRKGDHALAIEAYQRALQLKQTRNKDGEETCEDRAWLYFRMGKYYCQKHEYDEARMYWRKALRMFKSNMGKDHIMVSKITFMLFKLENERQQVRPRRHLISKIGNTTVPSNEANLKLWSSSKAMACVHLCSGKLSADKKTVYLDVP